MVRFVSLILTALMTGMLFCHVLELPNKMKLSADTWLSVQQVLYNQFGPVASVIEPLAIVSTFVLAVLVRKRRSILVLTAIALVCEIVHLAEWFAVVNPVNLVANSRTPATIPANWMHMRNQWEYGHAAGFVLFVVALVVLIIGAMLDQPARIHKLVGSCHS